MTETQKDIMNSLMAELQQGELTSSPTLSRDHGSDRAD